MITAEDLLDNSVHRYNELIAGEVRALNLPMMITADLKRSLALTFWLCAMGMYILENNLGRYYGVNVGFHLASDPDTVKAPDYAFIRQNGWSSPKNEGFVTTVPDLVIESAQDELLPVKINEWLSFGVRYVIDLNPAKQTLIVYRPDHEPVTLSKADTFMAEDILPGFSLPLTKVFPADE